jgi:hypothetical protein
MYADGIVKTKLLVESRKNVYVGVKPSMVLEFILVLSKREAGGLSLKRKLKKKK